MDTEFNDEYKTFVAISGEFSHAKPSIGPKNQSSSATLIKSYSHSAYDFRTDSFIDAANYYAATEVGAKMKSREAIYIYFNMSAEEGRKTQPTCQSINQLAYSTVV